MRSTKVKVGGRLGATVAVLVLGSVVQAAPTAQQKCDRKRFDAAANYVSCQQKAVGKEMSGGFRSTQDFGVASLKCTSKLAAKWESFRRSVALSGTVCAGERWMDNGSTVTDLLTGFEWEKKTTDPGTGPNPADIHDVDNTETWSSGGAAATGSIFTSFVPGLNSAGFAGQSDWRLPDYAELMSIMTVESTKTSPVCANPPCIPPVFGPTAMVPPTYLGGYWVSTTPLFSSSLAYWVDFRDGPVHSLVIMPKYVGQSVRAVRGGW